MGKGLPSASRYLTQFKRGDYVDIVVGNRQLRKKMHIRIEHLRKSRCNEAFLTRVKENDKKKREAKARGEKIVCKREPVGPKPGAVVNPEGEVEVLAPLHFVENYF